MHAQMDQLSARLTTSRGTGCVAGPPPVNWPLPGFVIAVVADRQRNA